MNVATITMDPAIARRKLQAARARLAKGHDEEYKALALGYAALAEGKPVIDLRLAMLSGGIDELGRPRLAFARADRRKVWLEWEGSDVAVFTAAPGSRWKFERRWPELVRRLSFAGHPRLHSQRWSLRASALVPMVPPEIRLEDPAPLKPTLDSLGGGMEPRATRRSDATQAPGRRPVRGYGRVGPHGARADCHGREAARVSTYALRLQGHHVTHAAAEWKHPTRDGEFLYMSACGLVRDHEGKRLVERTAEVTCAGCRKRLQAEAPARPVERGEVRAADELFTRRVRR
jgi:hypothetical protein